MADLLTLSLTQGEAQDFLLQRRDGNGLAYDPLSNPSPFLTTDTLAATVWPGGTLAPVATPAVAWVDAAGVASYQLSLAATDTAGLVGVYYWRVEVTRGTKTGVLGRGRLKVEVAPGSTVAPLTFTTRDDLLTYAPWLEDIQTESDEVAFGVEQLRATNKLIDAIVNLWKPDQLRPTLGQPGWNALNLSYGSSAPQSWWLRQQLVPLPVNSGPNAAYPDRMSFQANKIDPRVSTALLLWAEPKEVCAKWAIAYVCDAQLGRAGERDYWQMADRFRALGDMTFRLSAFQIDLGVPQTGWASFTVRGGGGSVR